MTPESGMVTGEYMERSLGEFVRACEAHLRDEQEVLLPNNALIATLCDAVRLAKGIERIHSIAGAKGALLTLARSERDGVQARAESAERREAALRKALEKASGALYEVHGQGIGCPGCQSMFPEGPDAKCAWVVEVDAALSGSAAPPQPDPAPTERCYRPIGCNGVVSYCVKGEGHDGECRPADPAPKVDPHAADTLCRYQCGPCRDDVGPWHQMGCPAFRDAQAKKPKRKPKKPPVKKVERYDDGDKPWNGR